MSAFRLLLLSIASPAVLGGIAVKDDHDSPLSVALGLGSLDLGLTLGVLLLTGSGPGRGFLRAADGRVAGFNGVTDEFLGRADNRVDLKGGSAWVQLCVSIECEEGGQEGKRSGSRL